ncbi:glycosyltransferase family 4 protein [Pseudoalteromonas xiamenensis]
MLVIDGIIYSLQSAGGVSVYFTEVLKRLPRNVSYELLLYPNSNRVLSEYKQQDMGEIKRIKLPTNVRRYLDVMLSRKCTVFHSSYYRLPIFFQRKRVKIVTTVHDFTYEYFMGGLNAKVHFWQKRRAILASDVIVCISENTKKDLLYFIPEARDKDIRVIYNGVSESFVVTDKNHEKTKNIIFIGSRVGYKNFSSLVSAMSQLTEYNLVIVGGGELSDEELSCLDASCKGRYKHLNFVDNTKLNQLYNQAHCLVYPSLYEGFGIPAIEAMKAGCPVIAANASSLPEVCSDAAILLNNISTDNITDAVLSLEDSDFYQSLVERGFNNSQRFSWDKTFQELSKIYLG